MHTKSHQRERAREERAPSAPELTYLSTSFIKNKAEPKKAYRCIFPCRNGWDGIAGILFIFDCLKQVCHTNEQCGVEPLENRLTYIVTVCSDRPCKGQWH